ncbi:MAG: peptide chain release factor N(5)-glutamine methyltransferase, partial [Limisphaerales bacterium]
MKSGLAEYFQELMDSYRTRFVATTDKPNESAEATLRGLWLCAAGNPVSAEAALTMELPPLTHESRLKFEELLKQRENGIPLAYLIGRQRFMGLEYICTSQALIPRKETEILGNAVCGLFKSEIRLREGPARVLDLCTGSGNLACAIALHCPVSVVFGVDISAEAIELATVNAQQLGCGDRVKFSCGDLFAPFESPQFHEFFDLIVCNPPYIDPSKLPSMSPEIIAHEPKLAFDGGPLGVRILWRLLQDAHRFLKPGGWLAFEVGLGQGDGIVRRLLRNPHFINVQGVRDAAGNIRAIVGQLK